MQLDLLWASLAFILFILDCYVANISFHQDRNIYYHHLIGCLDKYHLCIPYHVEHLQIIQEILTNKIIIPGSLIHYTIPLCWSVISTINIKLRIFHGYNDCPYINSQKHLTQIHWNIHLSILKNINSKYFFLSPCILYQQRQSESIAQVLVHDLQALNITHSKRHDRVYVPQWMHL